MSTCEEVHPRQAVYHPGGHIMPNEQPQQTIIPPIVAQEVGLLHLQLVMATQEIARLNQIITERQAQNVVTNPDSFDAG